MTAAIKSIKQTVEDMQEVLDVAEAQFNEDFKKRVHISSSLVLTLKLYATAHIDASKPNASELDQAMLTIVSAQMADIFAQVNMCLFPDDAENKAAAKMVEQIINIINAGDSK